MTYVVSGFGALLPSALLLWYFYKSDLYPEPRGVLIITFVLGILTVIPVLVVAIPVMSIQPSAHPLFIGFYSAFLTAALPEEFFKFLVVIGYCARNKAFDEPMDGVVYGATASLGFATLENLLYVSLGGWPVALIRAFTAVPLHAGLGAILGYYVGQARFNPASRLSIWHGFGFAVLLHGIYDFPLLALMARGLMVEVPFTGQEIIMWILLVLLALATLVVTVVWTVIIVRRLRKQQLEMDAASKYTFPIR